MSLHEQAKSLIDQAGVAIQADNPQYAIELLRQSILYNGKDGSAYILLGVALAHTKMPADAENAFIRATQLMPDSVKAWYNLAVHQYTQGQLHSALDSARRANEVDVRHVGSRELVAKIEGEMGIGPGERPPRTAGGNVLPPDEPEREGYEPEGFAAMPFVERLGVWWTIIGWLIALVSLAGFVVALILVQPHLKANINSEALMKVLQTDPRFPPVQVAHFLTVILSIIWTAMDAIHRRGNLLWVLPQIVCSCFGCAWLMLPIYLRFGRNN